MTKKVYYNVQFTTSSKQMGGKRNHNDIKYIVWHYTANYSNTAGAMAHLRYLNTTTRIGSAHYYVDKTTIVNAIPDNRIAYAVGDNQGYGRYLNGCDNYNSISIEICVNGGYNKDTLYNAIELTKALLKKFPNARVCRHWDVSRKNCPAGFTGNNNARWKNVLKELTYNRRMIIDLERSGYCTLVDTHNHNVKPPKFKGYFVKTDTPGDVLNVRCEPDPYSKIVSSYRHGSKIYVRAVEHTKNGTWYKIEYKGGQFGYVSARYCRGIK